MAARASYDPVGERSPTEQSHDLHDRTDLASVHSRTALHQPVPMTSYPPMPAPGHVQTHDFAQAPQPPYGHPHEHTAGSSDGHASGRTTPGGMNSRSRNGSWDLLAGMKQFETDGINYDTRNASEAHLAFAEGDVPDNKFSRFYHYLLNVSWITRWILFIVPILAILWIPGILSFTAFPHAKVWNVRLRWWSIWLSVLWGGWWGCLLVSRALPRVASATIGLVAVGSRRYIAWFDVLHRYVTLSLWSLAIWISFQPLILNQVERADGSKSQHQLSLIAKILFAIFLCSAILTAEKLGIQFIAGKFHEKSYAERIQAQKFAIKVLTILYRNSRDIPGRSDTMVGGDGHVKGRSMGGDPRAFLKKALKGVRFAATTTTTALGNVASEMAGSSVLQPNSPAAMVTTAIHSVNKTRLLARRLFYSFAQGKSDILLPRDIARVFPSREMAEAAFTLFDKDGNGDASRDEVEMACMEVHREQLSIEHSMSDLDSAVGRLDNILITVYVFVAFIIFAVVLDQAVVTLITGAGTLVLGLSWLIGSSLAEVLTSIIFLFIKHPYDVGDRVDLEGASYTVKEIRLLSTIFLDSHGASVQAPNTVINSHFVINIRRSPQMSETFPFDVHYSTTFEQLEQLRIEMLHFLTKERRDFLPSFDVWVVDIPDQEKMSLKAEIKYKSNWQQGALKAKRRNKWICTLKQSLEKVGIFGPAGNPNAAAPAPTKYTLVPWEQVQEAERKAAGGQAPPKLERMPTEGYNLTGTTGIGVDIGGDIFGEGDELNMTNPRRGAASTMARRRGPVQMPDPVSIPGMPSGPTTPAEDYIEMSSRTPRANQSWPQPKQNA